MDRDVDPRRAVLDIAWRMTEDGLVVGTSGNVSMRYGDRVAVTPSGIDYADMTIQDIPIVDLDGTVVDGDLHPTSELRMHLVAYHRHDAGAVVHTHSLSATAVSLVRDDVPAVHYQLAEFGAGVRVADYATFGSEDLAENMSAALSGSTGCILRNHGAVTLGTNLSQAYTRALQLEWLCKLWLLASGAGTPRLLGDAEMTHCARKFASYGQQRD